MIKEITAQKALEKLKNKTNKDCFLDVRTQAEWNEYKVDSFTHFITLDFILESLEELNQFDNIYITCKAGVRSLTACNILEQAGFKGNLYNISSGVIGLAQEIET